MSKMLTIKILLLLIIVNITQLYYREANAVELQLENNYLNGLINGGEVLSNEPCYLGMDVPTPSDMPRFSSNSPWNMPPTNFNKDPNSDAILAKLKSFNSDAFFKPNVRGWSTPIHMVNFDACPKVNVLGKDGNAFHSSVDPNQIGLLQNAPIPLEIWAEQESDGHVILIDQKKGKVLEFSKFKQVGNIGGKAVYEASTAALWDLNGDGVAKARNGETWWRQGTNGAGTPQFAGMVTFREMKAGVINHALSIAIPANKKRTKKVGDFFGSEQKELCADAASRTDGQGIGSEYMMEGQRIILDPTLNLDRLNLSQNSKVIARALQVYGAISTDNANGFVIKFQNLDQDGSGRSWIEDFKDVDLRKIPWNKYQILECENVFIFR